MHQQFRNNTLHNTYCSADNQQKMKDIYRYAQNSDGESIFFHIVNLRRGENFSETQMCIYSKNADREHMKSAHTHRCPTQQKRKCRIDVEKSWLAKALSRQQYEPQTSFQIILDLKTFYPWIWILTQNTKPGVSGKVPTTLEHHSFFLYMEM